MSDQVEVEVLPPCDLCKRVLRMTAPAEAYADCNIPRLGIWGYVCRKHFVTEQCRLGTGRGQRLVLRK